MGLLELFRITGRVAVEYSEAQRGIKAVSRSADSAAESIGSLSDRADGAQENVENFGDETEKAGKKTEETREKTSKFSKVLSSLGSIASKAGKIMSTVAKSVTAVMTAAGAGIVVAGKAATTVGSDFESSVSQLAATMGKSVKEIDDLKEKAKEMGAATQFSATEAADGLNILAMSGLDAKEQMVSIDKVLNLAAAGSLSLESAASYATGAVKGFGDEMGNMQYYTDLMAKGATLANTNVDGLGQALSASSATANSYKQKADSVTLSLLRLAEQNVTGEAAATSLNRAMADLYTPTEVAKQALDELGISAYDSKGNTRDFNVVVDEMNEKLKGMTAEEANAYKAAIFTTNGLNAFNKMTASTADTVDKFREGLASANGSAEKQAKTMIDNLEGDITLLKSAAEGLGNQFYETFNGKLRESVQFATNSITDLSEIFKNGDIKATAASMGKIMSTALLEITNNASQVGNIAADVIEGFTTGISNNLLKIKISSKKIVQSLIDGTIQMLPSVVESASEIIGVATVCVDRFIDGIKRNSRRIGNSAKEIVKSLSNGIVTFLPKQLQEPIKQTMSKIEKSFNNGGLKKALDIFKTTISKIGKTVTDITSKSLVPIVDIVDKLGDHIDIAIPAIVAWTAAVKGMEIVNAVNAALTGMTAATTAEQLATASSTGAITLKNIAVGVLTQNITLAEAAQLAWNTAMNANPIGIVIAAVSALAAGIGALTLITNDQTEAEKELKSSEELLDQQLQQYNDNLEIYAETLSEIFDKTTDFNSGISSAGDCLEGFNGSVIMSTEKQQELSKKMSEVQTEITDIARLATEERGYLTDTEIKRLEELFAKEKELADQQLHVKQEYQNVVKDMAEDLLANESISVEEYEAYAQQYINTAQTTRDESIKAAQEYKTNYLAERRAMIGTAKEYTEEWYDEERKNAEQDYKDSVNNTNKICADTLSILSNGYLDKSKALSDYCTKIEEYKQRETEIQTDYNKKLDKIEDDRKAAKDKAQEDHIKDYSSCERILNENLAEIDAEYNKKRADALEEAATKRSNLISDINSTTCDEVVQDNISAWLAMETNAALYGGKFTKKGQAVADSFIGSFDYLNDDMKEQAKMAMEGMLQGLEEKEPALYAKASSIADNFISISRTEYGINSPSRVFRKIYTQVIEGGEVGIEKEAPNLYKSADKTAKSFSERMKLSLSTGDFVSTAKTALHNNLDSMTRSLRTNFDINPSLSFVSGDSRMQMMNNNTSSIPTAQPVKSGSVINFTLQIENFNNTAQSSLEDLSNLIETKLYDFVIQNKMAVI